MGVHTSHCCFLGRVGTSLDMTLHVRCFLRPKYLTYIGRQEEASIVYILQMNKQRPEW